MRLKTKRNADQPVGDLKAISDFLPPPEELAPAEETTKVTLVLDKKSVDYFKSHAKKSKMKYQRMMRQVIKGYVEHYANRSR